MNTPAILDVFQSHPFLSSLKEWCRMRLASGVKPFAAAPGEYLAREGQPAHAFFLIQEGQIEICTSEDGKEAKLQTLGPGDVVGWSWIVPPHQWQFDCRAVGCVKGLCFNAAWLRDQCETDTELGYHVVKHLLSVIASRLAATRLLTKPLAQAAPSARPRAAKVLAKK